MARLPQGRTSPVGKRAASELAESQATRRLLPAENEKYALRGTEGYPSDSNRYVTQMTLDDYLYLPGRGGQTVEDEVGFTGGIIVPKTSGEGIKVDTTTPTFAWRDLVGDIIIRAPGVLTDPAIVAWRGGIPAARFSVNDAVKLTFHLPHDYVPGSHLHLHYHWSHANTFVDGGSVTWGAEVTYAKGHDRGAFPLPITFTVAQNASTTAYQHLIAEGQLSAATPGAGQIDTDDIEPDGVIEIRAYLSANNMTVSEGAVPEPFLHYVDIHYQSTGVGTKQKSPDFYT